MNVVALNPASEFDTAIVRNAAADLKPMIEHVRAAAFKAYERVTKARGIANIVLHYAKWLKVWHLACLQSTWAIHFREQEIPDGRHVVAALGIKSNLFAVADLIAERSHWLALPNVDDTRRRLSTNLLKTMNALDAAIDACAVLEGHQPAEQGSPK